MKYVIDLDRLSDGVDYWRNPDYKPQSFGSKNGFFCMVKNMQDEGNFVSAYSKEAEQNLPEIVRWFEMNGIKNIPIVFKKDDDMVEVWDDRAMHVDPETGEFVITQKLTDDQIKKTTYAPVKVEVTTVEKPEGFQDIDEMNINPSDMEKLKKAISKGKIAKRKMRESLVKIRQKAASAGNVERVAEIGRMIEFLENALPAPLENLKPKQRKDAQNTVKRGKIAMEERIEELEDEIDDLTEGDHDYEINVQETRYLRQQLEVLKDMNDYHAEKKAALTKITDAIDASDFANDDEAKDIQEKIRVLLNVKQTPRLLRGQHGAEMSSLTKAYHGLDKADKLRTQYNQEKRAHLSKIKSGLVKYADIDRVKDIQDRIAKLLAIQKLTSKEHDPEILAIDKDVRQVVKFASLKKKVDSVLKKLERKRPTTKGEVRKTFDTAIAEIKKAQKEDYVKVTDTHIENWNGIEASLGAGFVREETKRIITKENLKERVEEFEALDPDEQLVRIVSKTIDKDVAREVGAEAWASDIIDTFIHRPYQRDFFRRVKDAAGLQLAKDAVEKVDDIITDAKLGTVNDELHRVFFNQFIKSGEEKVRAIAKKLSGLPDREDIVQVIKARGLKTPIEQPEELATKILDQAFKIIQKKVVQVSKLATKIEDATPEELDLATKLLGEKQAYLNKLNKLIKQGEKIPQQKRSVEDFKRQRSKLLTIGLTQLERDIFTKRKRDKELKEKKKLFTPEFLGRKGSAKARADIRRKEEGSLNIKERMELVKSEYGISGPIGKEIASLYGPKDIMAAKPFKDKPQYAKLSTFPQDELMAKLKDRGVGAGEDEKEAKGQDSVVKANTSESPAPTPKPPLGDVIPPPATTPKAPSGKPDELKFQHELEGSTPEPELKGTPRTKKRTPEEQKANNARVQRYKDRLAAGGLSPENKIRRKQIIGLGGRFDPSASDEQYIQQIENLKDINIVSARGRGKITAEKGTLAYDIQKEALANQKATLDAINEAEYKRYPWMRPGAAGKSKIALKEEEGAKRQALINKINASGLPAQEKQRLIQMAREKELALAINEVGRIIGVG